MNDSNVRTIEDIIARVMQDSICPTAAVADKSPAPACPAKSRCSKGYDGIFDNVNDAVEAAFLGQKELLKLTLEEREELINAIRDITCEHAKELAQAELEETGMGRYADKVSKLIFTTKKTPGIEDIKPEVISSDYGLSVIERLPFGVACCITPVTGPAPTAIHNAICMIAAGNSVVFSPHPHALQISLRTVRLINEAIASVGGPKNIITSLNKSTIEKTDELIKHPKINLVVATGGPSLVNKVLSSGKKAIGAGAGNPPAMVDETADLASAAKCITAGNHFENGIQCICEKEIIVVESVADALISEMVKNGAYLIRDKATIDRLTELVTAPDGTPAKQYIGKDPSYILKALGIDVPADTTNIIYEVPRDHITAVEEYLMPIIPIIRAKDADEAIELSIMFEGGHRHTAMIHSQNITTLSKFAQAIGCTIVVKNGPSYAGLGLGGEGFMANTVAGPTGEGITSPRTFTRIQRCSLIGGFNQRGARRY